MEKEIKSSSQKEESKQTFATDESTICEEEIILKTTPRMLNLSNVRNTYLTSENDEQMTGTNRIFTNQPVDQGSPIAISTESEDDNFQIQESTSV